MDKQEQGGSSRPTNEREVTVMQEERRKQYTVDGQQAVVYSNGYALEIPCRELVNSK